MPEAPPPAPQRRSPLASRGASPGIPARRVPPAFDPLAHEAELRAILTEIAARPTLDARALDRIVRRHPKRGRGLFRKSEILAGLRSLTAAGRAPVDEAVLLDRLRMRPVRTLSGVTPVTLLTRPHPCPGRCIFCPSDVRMPKSYLADEPGAQRAEDNRFDPYLQTWNRLLAYREIGHPVDKVELNVLGGTWSSYPESYQVWFTTRCFDALSDFGAGIDGRARAGAAPARYRELGERVDGRRAARPYNAVVGDFLTRELGRGRLHPSERGDWERLAAAQRRNETAASRCVGLAFETRPDHVDGAELLRLRRLGATKLQVGLQSLSDAVLVANRRGHDVASARQALRLLRGAAFKLHVHWMANLLGSSPARDLADFERLFREPDWRPDELKLYPCVLIESAELAAHHARGAWQPYGDEELTVLLAECLVRVPEYCRVTRVIRDFSAADIAAGSRVANLREVAERRLAASGRRPRDIRSREIRGTPFETAAVRLRAREYATSIGREVFLEQVAEGDRLVAFLRLSLPREPAPLDELAGSALVRELHVYGASLPLGRAAASSAQHRGLGRALLAAAAERARAAGYRDLAVVSAVGTRAYYRRAGFRDGPLYQHRPL